MLTVLVPEQHQAIPLSYYTENENASVAFDWEHCITISKCTCRGFCGDVLEWGGGERPAPRPLGDCGASGARSRSRGRSRSNCLYSDSGTFCLNMWCSLPMQGRIWMHFFGNNCADIVFKKINSVCIRDVASGVQPVPMNQRGSAEPRKSYSLTLGRRSKFSLDAY